MEEWLRQIKIWFQTAWASIQDSFYATLIEENRYLLILDGLKNTLIMAFFATLIGIIIGLIVAVIKVMHKRTGKLKILNGISAFYTTVIRGTPIVLQLLIMYYIIFSFSDAALLVAIITFGINSGAYVAEIIRAGILAVDEGQTEAGRSLGLNTSQTMRYIVLPQALKNILPALGNEFIALLKETSVAGYVAIRDLTRAGDQIRSRTYDAFFPLMVVAVIYLILVIGLTKLQQMLERRLAKNDRH